MNLNDIWKPYLKGDYRNSLCLAVEEIAKSSGIDLLHIAGLSLINLRRITEGITLLKAAITFRPELPHIYANAAYLAEQSGLTEEAEYFADAGLTDFPDHPDLLLLKANCMVMRMCFDDAAMIYRRLLDHDPNHVQSLINLGNICRAKEQFDEARQWFARAETLEPDFRDLIFARATMYNQLGEDQAAIDELEPIGHDVDAQFLLSLLYLSRGDYERGFRLYRSRCNAIWFKTGNFVHPLRPFDHWTEAKGKRIAVIQEGGFGDLLQFIRYIPKLAEVAESITQFAPPTMNRLLRANMPANVNVEREYTEVADFHYVTTDVEMAYHFRSTIDTIPNTIPYLRVPEAAIEARRLPATSLKRVGLCWAGGQRDSLNQRNYDYRRSFDLDMYAPLGRVPGLEFVSLQVGQRAEQTCDALPLRRVLDETCDFLDTAAIIMQLDLVITVDTAVTHLAGALGKPVWLLSRYDSCWRWLRNRPDNPWYPGVMRVFGQKQYRDWSWPIAAVTEALEEFARG